MDDLVIQPTSIFSRIAKGTGVQAFNQIVQILIRLIEVPLFMHYWGPQRYGEWLMLAAIPSYLAISDIGFTTAACRDITMHSSSNDRLGALIIYQSIWSLLLFVSLLGIGITLITIHFASFAKWFRFTLITDQEVRIIIMILVVYVFLGFQQGLLNGGFWAAGSYPTGMFFSIFSRLLEFSFLVLAIILGGGPIQAAIGYLIGRIIGMILMWIGQQRVTPWLKFGLNHVSFSEIKRLTAPAFASLAFPLGNALNIQTIRIVIGLALGPTAVAIFTPLRTLSNFAAQPRVIINSIIEPEIAMAYGMNDISLFKKIFYKSTQFALWSCLIVIFLIGLFAKYFFPIWTNHKINLEWPVLIIMLISVLINSIWYTTLMIPYGINKHINIAPFYILIYGIGAALFSYLGALKFNLIGVSITLLIIEIIMSIIVIPVALTLTQIKLSNWLNTIILPPTTSLRTIINYFINK